MMQYVRTAKYDLKFDPQMKVAQKCGLIVLAPLIQIRPASVNRRA
jgi:hypothetical protein